MFLVILSLIFIVICLGGVIWSLIDSCYAATFLSVLGLGISILEYSMWLSEYNTVYTITTHYLDKEISYPVDVEVIRTEKAATKHQEEIAEKLYNDLNRVDSTWTMRTKDNNIIVSNGKKYYVFYMLPCKIKNK